MASLSRIRLAFLLVPAFVAGFAFSQAAPKINNGKGVVMGSLRGGSLGAASGFNYQTGRHGLNADYHQPVRRMPSANDPVHRLPANDPVHRLPAKAKTPVSGLAKGIKGLLKSPIGKANIAAIVLTWGLSEVIERNGLILEDDGVYYYPDNGWEKIEPAPFVRITDWRNPRNEYSSIHAACISYGVDYQGNFNKNGRVGSGGGCCNYSCSPKEAGFTYYQGERCNYPYKVLYGFCGLEKEPVKMPITDAHIDALNMGRWYPPENVPKPAVEQVYPYISPADTTIELAPITVTAPKETVSLPDGTVKETTKKETISVSNPNTDPALVVSTQTTTNTYQDGQMTGSETTTTTTDATAATPTESAPAPEPEPITDCAFFPTLCKWLDWTQQPPPSDADLPALIPVTDLQDVEQQKDVRFGTAVCPTPSKIYIATIGKTVEFDWAFICQIAEKIKYFILAAAYLMAIRINLGVLRG